MKNLISVARGRKKADLVFKNGKIVDVFNHRIMKGDVAICGRYIAGIGEPYTGEQEIDLHGSYILPGLIDGHLHIESSMVSPIEYAKAVMPKGVTTIVADPHEIANVCGEAGLRFMLDAGKKVPLEIQYMLPSSVPSTPFEDAGAVLDSKDIKRLIPGFYGLGEMMNYVGVINCDDEVLDKLTCAKPVDGHAPLLTGKDLNAYICGNILTDHECTTPEELLEKTSKGMYISIREGTLSKNLATLLPAINDSNYRRCTFCTDDKFIEEIYQKGTILYSIQKAVKLGLDPFKVISMATLNTAECYELTKKGAIAPGYFADLIITDGIVPTEIQAVYKNGVLVAEQDKALFDAEMDYKNYGVINTVHLSPVQETDFAFPVPAGEIPVIHVTPGVITTTMVLRNAAGLPKVCVLERHKETGTKGFGFVENFDISGGAIASTIGHDSHNVIVIGDNDRDMALAVNALGKNGGIAVCSNGSLLTYLPLPIAGLMSDNTKQVIEKHRQLYEAVQVLQITPDLDPFMCLSFLSLPVIPEIRITNKGLFDVMHYSFIKL